MYKSLLTLVIWAAVGCVVIAQQQDVPHVLFVTESKGFVHQPVNRGEATRSAAELAMLQLSKDSGEFTVAFTQDTAADFTKENLQKFDIVAFYTSGDLPIEEETFNYFRNEWLNQAGRGVLGFHSATDTLRNYKPYWDLMGGSFESHPWTAESTVTMLVHDATHPAMRPFEQQRFEFKDEIYQYTNWQPEKVRVLMSLDMEHTQLKRPYHVPVAWCKQIGQGRLFYNNMGHREETWSNQAFLDSIVGAVRWIAGKEQGDASPNPELSQAQHADSIRFAHAAGVTEEKLEAERKAREAAQRARRAARRGAAEPDQ
jgi:uncharacterized protein